MVAGDLEKPGGMLIASFKQFQDFYPALIAANLRANGVEASEVLLDLPELGKENFVTGRILALYFEKSDFRSEVVKALRPHLGKAARIGFPAALGIEHAVEVMNDLEKQLGLPVFEIPTLPPSIPGMRLSRLLIKAIEKNGGRVYEGMQAVGAKVQRDATTGGTHILSVQTEASARLKSHAAHKYVLATGGLLGGGAKAEYTGVVKEAVFNLPSQGPTHRSEWLRSEFLTAQGHPIFKAGLQVNRQFQPVDERGQALYDNLMIAGAALGGWDGIVERSLEGVALATGYLIGKKLMSKVETL
jgi:glycerol-3-phosphate dehydrogenase subunit B